jgi:hypothetical protein
VITTSRLPAQPNGSFGAAPRNGLFVADAALIGWFK